MCLCMHILCKMCRFRVSRSEIWKVESPNMASMNVMIGTQQKLSKSKLIPFLPARSKIAFLYRRNLLDDVKAVVRIYDKFGNNERSGHSANMQRDWTKHSTQNAKKYESVRLLSNGLSIVLIAFLFPFVRSVNASSLGFHLPRSIPQYENIYFDSVPYSEVMSTHKQSICDKKTSIMFTHPQIFPSSCSSLVAQVSFFLKFRFCFGYRCNSFSRPQTMKFNALWLDPHSACKSAKPFEWRDPTTLSVSSKICLSVAIRAVIQF